MEGRSRDGIRVAVLAGGFSSEREISLASGEHAMKAIREAGYGVVELLDPSAPGFLAAMEGGSWDVAFIALHGAGGEDGMIQHVLEYLGVPYTGSDAASSVCGADKELSKLLYERAGIPVAKGVALERGQGYDVPAIIEELGRDLFVKPAINGSSYGVSKVEDASQLPAAIERAFDFSDKVLIEQRLVGVEVSEGVLGGEDLTALPVVEIRCPADSEFYDLDVKYVDPTDIHRIPAELAADDYARVQELACRAHRALGCTGFSRSDFIVTDQGPVILETNTIPGMTETSLFPDELRHAGIAFSEACAQLIDIALDRAADGAER